jgi:hypothetical protein
LIILKTRKFRITESIDEIKDYKGEKVEACKTAGFLINQLHPTSIPINYLVPGDIIYPVVSVFTIYIDFIHFMSIKQNMKLL